MDGQFARAYLGIGEVLVELRVEFPDISVSKIRFLESEGLITPARSPSGYRRFGPADVDQLRFILTAQRDHYLPLRVIKERLEHLRDAEPGDSGHGDRDRTEMVSKQDLLDAARIDEDQLAELEAHGLVRRVGRLYSSDALDVAATISALASYGVQARHLRSVRTAADRDISLIEQLVTPTLRQRSPQARTTAGKTAREIAALLLRLHQAMLESALADAGLPGDELPEQDDVAGSASIRGQQPGGLDRSKQPGGLDRSKQPGGLDRRGLNGASA
jgi:DNA-binding transcriptional MerR regulator